MKFFDSIKKVMFFGSSNLLASAIGGIFWLYIASIMTREEYGELGYLISFAYLGSTFALLGLRRTIIVYGAKEKEILGPSYALCFVSASVIGLIVYFITNNLSVVFLLFGIVFFVLSTSGLISKQKYNLFSKYKILRSILAVILGLSLFFILGIDGIILGYFFSNLPLLIEVLKRLHLVKPSFKIFKEKKLFMIENSLSELSHQLFWWGDKIIIANMLGFSFLGSFHLASQYILLLNNVPLIATLYFLPLESINKKNKKLKIYFVIIVIILILISIFVVPIFLDNFFTQYSESIILIQIMSVGIIPLTLVSIYESEYLGKEKSRIVLIGSGIGVISYFILIPLLFMIWETLGIGLAFLISSSFRALFYVMIKKFLG